MIGSCRAQPEGAHAVRGKLNPAQYFAIQKLRPDTMSAEASVDKRKSVLTNQDASAQQPSPRTAKLTSTV